MRRRILLADDHQIFRQGLRNLLEKVGHEVIGEAADGRAASVLAQTLKPDVAVLDLSMPLLNGLDAAHEIQRVSPQTATILLTMHADKSYVLQALRAGARGYVLKTQAAEDLICAVHEISAGGLYLSPGVAVSVVDAYLGKTGDDADTLTPRERQTLQLIAEGKTTKEISRLLGLSVKTAESHRTRLMQKLDIHDAAGLVRYAIRRGIIRA